jgi:hypothetical protein
MSQNIGTLITAPIRPNDSLDPIAVAFANETKGGHHAYATLDERNSIIGARRDWGMLVTIYGDATASNNKTYQLSFSYSSSSLIDNDNWVGFSSGASVDGGGEWLNSVISRTSSIPLSNNNGNRYLIIGTISGSQSMTPNTTWDGYVDSVAEYSSAISSWNFTFPTEGTSLRVDNEINTLYKYKGIYGSGGSWVYENINQVFFITATSSNGYDYTAYANINSYSRPSVFYTNFATSSAGPSASLNINGLGKITIKKVSSNALDNIGLNDLNTTVEYQLIYDGTYFQTPILSAVNQIGPAENGSLTYTGGLYTDFTSTTQIGTPVDRFNQILKSLVPPTAPALTYWNGTFSAVGIGLNTGVGKLSFPSIGAINYNQATASPYGNVFLNGTWGYGATADGGLYRLGIVSNTTSNPYCVDLFGTLNYNIATQSNTPTPAYVRGSFGYATTGYLIMKINGLTVSSLSLTNSLNATNSTVNYTTPGFSVSSATSSKFPGGDPFDLFYNRTGNWYLPKTCLFGSYSYNSVIGLTANQFGITRGYNSITINHNRNNTDNILSRIEFVLDDNSTKPSYSNTIGSSAFFNPTINSTKTLSGIAYVTNLTLTYQTDIFDIYKNTFSNSGSAIQWSEIFTLGNTLPNTITSIIPTTQISAESLSDVTGDINSAISKSKSITINTTTSASKRRINDPISVYISTLLHPINSATFSTATSERAVLTGVVLYTFSASSTIAGGSGGDQTEDFNDETYRLATDTSATSYPTITSVTTGAWNSASYLNNTTELGLQIYNGRLYYPTLNWQSYGDATSNPNFLNSNTNYALNGTRYYFRYFYDISRNSSQFTIAINAPTGTLVKNSGSLTGNNFQVNIKLPGTSGAHTAWLDCAESYNSSTFTGNTNGEGIYFATGISGVTTYAINSSGNPFALNIGSKNTVNSNGYVVIRVTVGTGWTGNIEQIKFRYY